MVKLIPALIWLFLSSALLADEPAERPLHFCNSHWPPYSYGDASEQAIGGYAVDFMGEVSRRIEQPVKLSILPWLRCLKMAKAGAVDGIMLLTESDERKQFLTLSEPFFSDANLLWYRRDSSHARERLTFEELRGLRIGVVAGYNYGEPFNQAVADYGLILDEAPSIQSNFRRLDRNWIDVFPVNRMAANYALYDQESLRSRLEVHQGPFEAVGFRLGLAKTGRAAGLIDRFNGAIDDMLEDGTVSRIVSQQPFEYQ